MPVGPLVLDALATYRVTRLIVEDDVPLGPARDWVTRRWPDSKLTELIGCPWCASMYVAAAVVTARATAPRAWAHFATVLAMSAATGLLSTWETRD